MSKSLNGFQYSGVGAEVSAGAAIVIWPDQLWIAYILFSGGLLLIFWPTLRWAKTIHIRLPFHKTGDTELSNDESKETPTWIPIIEAIDYIFKHIGMSGTNDVDNGYIILEVMSQIRQAAHEGVIALRGNKEINRDMPGANYDTLKTKVRAEYWENMEIDCICNDPDSQEDPQTEPSVLSDYNAESKPKYFHLEIKRQDMLNRWNDSAIKERSVML